jgi:hypothetical protein
MSEDSYRVHNEADVHDDPSGAADAGQKVHSGHA